MAADLLRYLGQIHFVHPLHPALAHIPIGCIVAAFILALISWTTRNPSYFQSARHCIAIALVFLPLTALTGYLDLQKYYGGAWLWPVKIKAGLAIALFLLMLASNTVRLRTARPPAKILFVYFVFCLLAAGIGYFGGSLVYGQKMDKSAATSALSTAASQGQAIFQKKCPSCRYRDRTDKKVGPSPKGMANWRKLPVSGLAMTDENVRKQIVTPYLIMPPFDSFSPEEMKALLAYLKSL
jgi:uncharacterized membrane protein